MSLTRSGHSLFAIAMKSEKKESGRFSDMLVEKKLDPTPHQLRRIHTVESDLGDVKSHPTPKASHVERHGTLADKLPSPIAPAFTDSYELLTPKSR